ncbi:germin-like protein subfamily 3 member 4 [Silene latifolia]|uniref:germin-like protein subfamily 3 member 4 n=1 Tax=Silene latifolia TaxID=37657 RepID=UPI003D776A4A
MLNSRCLISSLLLIAIKVCLADDDNIQDFCPAAISNSNDPHNQIFFNGLPCQNPANVTASDFKSMELKEVGDTDNFFLSSTNIVTAKEFPGLNTLGLALGRTDIEIDGIVSPHSHPRAAEIIFVSKGIVTIGFIDTGNQVFKKMLREGDVFIVPKGMLHFCYNTGFEFATLISVLNSQNPGVIDITGTVLGSGSETAAHVKQRLASLTQQEVEHTTSQATASNRHSEL